MEHTLKDGRALRIAPAREADAAAIVDYMNAVGGESDNLTFGAGECRYTVEAERAYIAGLDGQPTSTMLLGWLDGALVACAMLSGDARERLAHSAVLGISVRRACWRLGIGEALLRAIIARAKQGGTLRVIHLTVNEDNVGAIALYERLGFARIGVHRAYMRVGDIYKNALIMDLHL